MATQNIFDLTDTWNNVATTFAAVKMNVTDTASAAGSLLMDLQLGGVSRFQVTKGGNLIRNAGSYQTTIENERIIIAAPSGGGPNLVLTQTGIAAISLTNVASTGVFALSGATIFEQRNGTSAQTFRIYNTYTDASNYERGSLEWTANALYLRTQAAGTGSSRNLILSPAGGYVVLNTTTDRIGWNNATKLKNSSDGVLLLQNNAEDNFSRIQFGGTTTAFPALGRNGATLRVLLADGSAFAPLEAGQIQGTGSVGARVLTPIPAGGTTGAGVLVSSTANFGVFFGSGAPTLSAAKGSLYLRSDGTTTNDRMYVNTDGATTWTAVTTAA